MKIVDDAGKPLEGLIVDPAGPAGARKWDELSRDAWTCTASNTPEATALAIDGDAATRWSTGGQQVPGMWYQVESIRLWVTTKPQ